MINVTQVSKPLYTTLLTGLERLVVAGIVRGRALDQVQKSHSPTIFIHLS